MAYHLFIFAPLEAAQMEQDSSRIAVADTLELAEQSSHLDEEKAAKSSAEDTWNARYHVSRRSYVSPVNHPRSVNYMNWSRHGGCSSRRGRRDGCGRRQRPTARVSSHAFARMG